jgi:membrane protease YdiL (CAAX protease family)
VVVLVLFRTAELAFNWISYDLLKLPRIVVPLKTALTNPHGIWFFTFVFLPVWALAEEILVRAYLIQRIEVLASPWRHATLIAVLSSSAVHVLAHLGYGIGGALTYFISGLVFAVVYLYSGRSLWFVAVIHYLMNLSALVGLNLGLAK